MKYLKQLFSISVSITLSITLTGTNVLAQNSGSTKFNKVQKPIIINTAPIAQTTQSAFSERELKDIFGESGPRPGIYTIKSIHSRHCIINRVTNVFTLTQALRTHACNDYTTAQTAIIPHPNGGYTMRVVYYNHGNNPFDICYTVARNVVLGPSEITTTNCGTPQNATSIGFKGLDDQRFTFKKVIGNTYIINTNNGECWDVRNQSIDAGSEIIRWACTGNANQKFELTYNGSLPENEDTAALSSIGYKSSPADGLWRMNYIPNISFTGTPYASFETKKDNGQECARLCLAQSKCVNWVYNASDPAINPICSLRDSFSSPIRTQGTMGGSIRH